MTHQPRKDFGLQLARELIDYRGESARAGTTVIEVVSVVLVVVNYLFPGERRKYA
jgi:hypothetical protein